MKPKKILAAILFAAYAVSLYFMLEYITGHALLIILATVLSMLFMVVTHELGHLIFGLATGYKFVSFRIFSLMLLRENGKFKLRRMSIPGTGGQCLMTPPEKKDGKYPYVLYNLGGILFCGVLSLVPLLWGLFGSLPEPYAMLLFIFGFVSFVMNLMNAIPTSGKQMANDATNLRFALKSSAAREALWNQLTYISLHAQGVRTADMPAEMFALPEKTALNNALIVWQCIAAIEREEDAENYEKAKENAYYLLDNAPFLIPLYRSITEAEALYLEILSGGDGERIEKYYESLKKAPSMQTLASTQRVYYAYQLLFKKDENAAALVRKTLEKKLLTAPYAADRDFEKRQLAYIDNKTEKMN